MNATSCDSVQPMRYNDGNNLRGIGVTSGVYEIEDLGNGRVYIGSSVDVEARLRRHRFMLEKGTHFCQHLQNSYTLRGCSSFVFRLVTVVDIDGLRSAEEAAIRSYPHDRLYNRILSPISGVLGMRWVMSEETKKRISLANKGRGRPQSPETRAKISAAVKERWDTQRSQMPPTPRIRKVRASQKGRVFSAETRAKMSAAQRGRKRGPMSVETRQKISAAKMGRASQSPSAETRAKRSAALRESWRRRKELEVV